MKNMLTLLTSILISEFCIAQIVSQADYDSYRGDEIILKGSKIDYIETALKIKDLYGLDKNNAITRTTIVDSPNKTKNEIYIEVNNWFVHSFNSGKSVIQLNEKESGVIIGKGYLNNIATHTSMTTNSILDAWVIIRVDIKEDKFRVMATVQEYDLEMGAGIIGAMSSTGNKMQRVQWVPKDCFPFDSKNYKKTTSKAFVNCHIWIQIVTDRLIEAVLHGITGTEEEW
jgi:hypothetical protein